MILVSVILWGISHFTSLKFLSWNYQFTHRKWKHEFHSNTNSPIIQMTAHPIPASGSLDTRVRKKLIHLLYFDQLSKFRIKWIQDQLAGWERLCIGYLINGAAVAAWQILPRRVLTLIWWKDLCTYTIKWEKQAQNCGYMPNLVNLYWSVCLQLIVELIRLDWQGTYCDVDFPLAHGQIVVIVDEPSLQGVVVTILSFY